VRIGVRDHGPGYPPDLAADGAEQPRGSGPGAHTGLGLPIARAIAEAHGGRLELANEPGGGALATLVFGAADLPRHDRGSQTAGSPRPS
jgi:signal transduction histidine kinase